MLRSNEIEAQEINFERKGDERRYNFFQVSNRFYVEKV